MSAQLSDRDQNLGFELNGSAQRPAKLASFERKDGRLLLNYDTTLKDARARVEITPAADRVHLKTWVLNNDGNLATSNTSSITDEIIEELRKTTVAERSGRAQDEGRGMELLRKDGYM